MENKNLPVGRGTRQRWPFGASCSNSNNRENSLNEEETTDSIDTVDPEFLKNKKWGKARQVRKHKLWDELPTLVIEYILSRFSYREVLRYRLISKRWNEVAKNYLQKVNDSFVRNLSEFRIQWAIVKEEIEDYTLQALSCVELESSSNMSVKKKSRSVPRMSRRYRHQACYIDGSMYIFGGFTSQNTSYNDLWRFDCSTKRWNRIVAEGNLPLPRFYFSLNAYETIDEATGQSRPYLVLFGGVLTDTALDTKDRIISYIHMFDIRQNRWILIETKGEIQVRSGGHSAVVICDELIVASGYRMVDDQTIPHDKVLLFNLKTHYWSVQTTSMLQAPLGKFNHSKYLKGFNETRSQFPTAFKINNHNILFISNPCVLFEEACLLRRQTCPVESCQLCLEASLKIDEESDKAGIDITSETKSYTSPEESTVQKSFDWEWIKCTFISNDTDSTSDNTSLGQMCQVGNLIVFMTLKRHNTPKQPFGEKQILVPPAFSARNLVPPVNRMEGSEEYQMSLRTSMRERRLAMLEHYEEYFKRYENDMDKHSVSYRFSLNLIDTSQVLEQHQLIYRRPTTLNQESSPRALRYFSLVASPSALLLFGGFSCEEPLTSQPISNQLYIILSKPQAKLY